MRVRRWPVVLLGTVVLLLGVLFVALGWWLHTDDTRLRLEREASSSLGIPVKLGGIGLALYPLPALELRAVELQTRPPLSLGRLELRLSWAALFRGELRVDTAVVDRAVLPQAGIDKLLAVLQIRPSAQAGADAANRAAMVVFLPRRTVLEHLTWVDTPGKSHTLQAEAYLDTDAWPSRLEVQVLDGRWQGAELTLLRAEAYSWNVSMHVAGGTVQGTLALQPAESVTGDFVVKGQLQTRDVELSRLTSPDPSPASLAAQPVTGRLEASTTLSARARQPSALLDVLQTQSRFSVRSAVLRELDLASAAKTAGTSRGGKTQFEILSGEVATRGKHIELRNLSAKSGALSARGQVSVPPNRRLTGLVNVELGGAVGVPLLVGGTLDDPELSLTAGAKIGAALGTMLMPGLGTGAGATVGGKIGEGLKSMFGADAKP